MDFLGAVVVAWAFGMLVVLGGIWLHERRRARPRLVYRRRDAELLAPILERAP